jgi:hypothetical protein
MSKLVIVVPVGRRRAGRALLLGGDGRTWLGPVRVLATASSWRASRHGNPDRDWHRPFGDTPTGSYVVGGSLPPGVMPSSLSKRSRFGMLGALVLDPAAGNALEAAKRGRTRFLLHGGPSDAEGRLRPTFGGLRVADKDLRDTFRAVNAVHAEGDPVTSVEVAETIAPSWPLEDELDEAGRFNFTDDGDTASRRSPFSVSRAMLVTLGFTLRVARSPAGIAR